MELEIYGGNPRIVASYEEMQRVASALDSAADAMRQALHTPQANFFDLIPNPIPQLQLLFLLPGLIERAESLARKTRFAAESYFSNEARVVMLIEKTLAPLSGGIQHLSPVTPIPGALSKSLLGLGAAMAVMGLSGKPNLSKTAVLALGAQVATASVGVSGGRELAVKYQRNLPAGFPVAHGSASLSKISQVKTSASMADHALRIWESYQNQSSINIEVYQYGYGRQLVVYIPGTQSASLSGENPLNLSSNLTALANLKTSAPEAAIQDALNQLGAGQKDRVLFVGHSQGAMVAGNIAQAPQPYKVSGLISFGGPISQLDLKIPTIAIGHQGDPVPLIGGGVNPMRDNWVTVSAKGEFTDLVDVHKISSYFETARALDLSSDEGFRRVQEQLWQDPNRSGLQYEFEIRRN